MDDIFKIDERIIRELSTKFKIYVYSDVRETYDEATHKWVHCAPKSQWFYINDIRLFRKQTEEEHYVFESTIMPTEWSLMNYYDKYSHKNKIIPVVGNCEELNNKLWLVKEKHNQHLDVLRKMDSDIKEIYSKNANIS